MLSGTPRSRKEGKDYVALHHRTCWTSRLTSTQVAHNEVDLPGAGPKRGLSLKHPVRRAALMFVTVAVTVLALPRRVPRSPQRQWFSEKADWGNASADVTRTSRGTFHSNKLIVTDTSCDDHAVYAYFEVHATDGRLLSAPGKRQDDKRCHSSGSTYTNPKGLLVSTSTWFAWSSARTTTLATTAKHGAWS